MTPPKLPKPYLRHEVRRSSFAPFLTAVALMLMTLLFVAYELTK